MGIFDNLLKGVKEDAIKQANKLSREDRVWEKLKYNSLEGRVQKMADESGREIKTSTRIFKPKNKR